MKDEGDLHAEGRVVEAAGHATAGGQRGQAVEQAMHEATEAALEEGVTDPEEIKRRKLAARAEVRAKVKTGTRGHGQEVLT
jgi:hypothetical protein